MDGAKGDLIFVIFAILAIGLVWFFTGGPERTRTNPGAFLKPPSPIGSGEVYGNINIKSGSVNIDSDKQDGSIKYELIKNQDEIKTSKTNSGFSEFNEKITIKKNLYGLNETSPNDEYLTLYANNRNNEKISITGWTLESVISGKKIKIGKGVKVYTSGIINSEQNINVMPGETVIITTGISPIGVSFKLNKCAGYFEQFQDFSPSLSKRCPYPDDEYDNFAVISANDFTCEDVIDDVRRCEMSLNALPIGTTNECSNFIAQNINYTGCVKNHKNDLDFIEKEWRVFLGRNEKLWRKKREIIRLLDNKGKVVDTYTY